MSARSETELDRRHLRREMRTAVELAIAALAPTALVDQLAAVAGILEALDELPTDAAPVRAMTASIVTRAHASLEAWRAWRAARGLEGV
jgi:hypothetical protein